MDNFALTPGQGCVTLPDMAQTDTLIDISDLDKAAVLAALYNRARPLGMGFTHFTPEDMSVAEAQAILDKTQGYAEDWIPNRRYYFDYVNGRVMKVDLSEDSFDPRLYDRDNGQGAAKAAIDHLRTQVAS